jgi:hypothetical protein
MTLLEEARVAADRLEALVGPAVRLAASSSRYGGDGRLPAMRALAHLCQARPEVGTSAAELLKSLTAIEARAPNLMAVCAAGEVDAGMRSALVRTRNAVQHMVAWLPPICLRPGQEPDRVTPVQRLGRALTWGLTPNEARRWLSLARMRAARTAAAADQRAAGLQRGTGRSSEAAPRSSASVPPDAR